MKIKLMANRAFENQRMLMNLNGVINYLKDPNMFIKNNEVGVYEIERYKTAMKPEEKEAFWKKVAESMKTAYDVEIKKDTFSIYVKGANDKLTKSTNNSAGEVKENDNDRHEETIEQQTKAPAKSKAVRKSKKVQTNK